MEKVQWYIIWLMGGSVIGLALGIVLYVIQLETGIKSSTPGLIVMGVMATIPVAMFRSRAVFYGTFGFLMAGGFLAYLFS